MNSASPPVSPVRTAMIFLWIAVSVGCYLLLGYYVPRHEFGLLLGVFALLFLAYYHLQKANISIWQGIGLALVFRLLFLISTPALSDDYARFLWDGRLLLHGENPFLHLPAHYLNKATTAIPGITQELFSLLNSPHYYSVYPPVLQFVFWLAALIAPEKDIDGIVVMRLVIIAAEAGTLVLLLRLVHKMALPLKRVWLYAFNPLIIAELTGNLHFEALVIFFLLLAFYLLFSEKWAFSAVAFALAVASKLVPLLFLPLLLRRLGLKHFLAYCAIVGGVFLLSFAPFASEALFRNIFNSVDLYFQKFEFNASIYYLARYIGFRISGYNQITLIGPALSVLVFLGVLALALFEKHHTVRSLPETCLAALTLYLLLATTVHPWYISTLVALSCFSHFRFAVVWSGLAVLSYAAYQTETYQENLVLVALEYGIVFVMLSLELLLYRTPEHPHNLLR